MMEPQESISVAKRIEEAKLENLKEQAKSYQPKVTLTMQQAAASGGISGGVRKKCVEIRIEAITLIIDGMISERKRLAKPVPFLVTRTELNDLRTRLKEIIDNGVREIFIAESPQPLGMPTWLRDEVIGSQQRMTERLDRDLTILEGDASLDRISSPPGTITISAGPNSVISVGNTATNIISTLKLNNDGGPELSVLLHQLVEEIQKANNIADEVRAVALENLEFVVQQLTAHSETRAKPSIVRGAWNHVAESVAFAANLAQLVATAAPLLETYISQHWH